MWILGFATDLASFGAAGLMGAMWLWERRMNRTRDEQLTDAHERIRRDEQRLEDLTRVVEQNTAALARFTETHRDLSHAVKDLREELHHVRTR